MDEMKSTTTRTDVHSPKSLVTEDYDYVMSVDNRAGDNLPPMTPPSEWLIEQMRRRAEAARLVASSPLNRGLSQCHHCGAHIRWSAVLHHRPSDTHIAVGETCLDNRFERATEEFQQLRKAAELDREKMRIRTARLAFVEANPDLAWMDSDDPEDVPEATRHNEFVLDVARKLRRYGELSDKQVNAVRSSIQRDIERAAKRAAEKWVRIPQEGRIEVTGVILSTKWIENDFGTTEKMLLKVDHGDGAYKLWMTVPSKAGYVEAGDQITVRVKIERSRDDETFGFGSRPSYVSSEAAARP